jgi:hypothetical protein
MHVLNPDMEAVTLYVSCMSWPLHPQALPCWAPVSIKQLFSFLFFFKKVFASSAGTGGQNYCCKNTHCHTSNKEHGTRRGDGPKIVSASLFSRPISASFHHFASSGSQERLAGFGPHASCLVQMLSLGTVHFL